MNTGSLTKHGLWNCAASGASLFLVMAVLMGQSASAESRCRTELTFPDLPGWITLRCDFHLHTVFSDGDVWPTVRVEEAWRDGLDAIALTDHIEYHRHKADILEKHGRAAEVARAQADALGLILIRGAEITRSEPPGHLNALFLTNEAALDQKDYWAAIRNAYDQGAFLTWNHPGWKQPDRKSVWYEEQGQFYTNGWLRGIEIVNGADYDPIAHQWCLDKRLTLIAGSDAHDPIAFEYKGAPDDIRPLTLVFAQARSPEAIREALLARRTVVCEQGKLIGEPEYLEALFQRAIEVVNPEIRIRGKGRALVQIRNTAPVDFELNLSPKLPELDVQEKVVLRAGKISLVGVRCVSERVSGEQQLRLPCRVVNLIAAPGRSLRTALALKVKYEPGG